MIDVLALGYSASFMCGLVGIVEDGGCCGVEQMHFAPLFRVLH
jgi:hypothetical protein